MKKMTLHISLALAMTCLSGVAFAQISTEELLNQVSTYEFGQSRILLTAAEQWVAKSLANPASKRSVARDLASILERDSATFDAKQFVCRQLAVIGDAPEVPALAALLEDPATADIARYALEPMQCPQADDALLEALENGPAEAKEGMVNSLGKRGTAAAIKPLTRLANGGDARLAEAAIDALGNIGSPKAEKALRRIERRASGKLAEAVWDARLECAEASLKSGNDSGARRIYKALYEGNVSDRIRAAAYIGLVENSGEDRPSLLKEGIESENAAVHEAAVMLNGGDLKQ